ncbi:MAG: mechanosensitive ion channel family protein [Thermoplasmata archaeon]
MPRRIAFVVVSCLLVMAVLGQNAVSAERIGNSDLLVFPVGEHDVELHLRESVTHVWTVCNAGMDAYYLEMNVDNPDTSFGAILSPTHLYFGSNQSESGCEDVTLTVSAPTTGEERTVSIGVQFNATSLWTEETFNKTFLTFNRLTGVTPPADPEGKVLGTFDNPLPSPLDNQWGAFVLTLFIWILVALLVVGWANFLARFFVRKSETKVDDMIVEMMRGPILLLILFLGIQYSLPVAGIESSTIPYLDSVFSVVTIVLITWIAYKLFKDVLIHYGSILSARTQTDIDDRLVPVISKVGGVIIILLGMIFVIQSLGYDVTLFLAGLGIMGIVIGFAAQETLSNFFSGIFLLLDRPFKTGDLIVLDSGEVCEVSWIGLRSTKLYHIANHQMIVLPNKLLAEQRVVNITEPDRRFRTSVSVGVAYGTDLDHARKVLTGVVRGHPNVLKGKEKDPLFRVDEFADSSINLRVIFWVDNVDNKWRVESELKEAIDKRFKEENIEIPFPVRTVYMHAEQKM